MTTLTQFLGGGDPIGSLTALVGHNANPTIKGAEYLKTSVLKAVAGYEASVTLAPQLGVVVGVVGNIVSTNTLRAVAGTNNGYIYAMHSGSFAPRYATSVSGIFADVTSGTAAGATDYCTMGARLVITHLSSTIGSILTTTNTPQTVTGNHRFCAANTAGTLCVTTVNGPALLSGDITTSTDGATFTNRTPSLSMGGLAAVMWSRVSSTFLYVGSGGALWSSPDGFTLTARTALPNVTSVTAPTPNANSWASSPTSTILVAYTTLNGVASTPTLCRTTNGTSMTTTALATALGFDGFSPTLTSVDLRIAYVGSEYIIWTSTGSTQSLATSVMYKSTDDGVTWVKRPVWVNPSVVTVNDYVFGQGTGPTTAFVASAGVPLLSVPTPTTATHIGMVQTGFAHSQNAAITVGYAPLYVRIK